MNIRILLIVVAMLAAAGGAFAQAGSDAVEMDARFARAEAIYLEEGLAPVLDVFAELAEQGHPGGMFYMFLAYAEGTLVPQSDARAASFLQQSAEAGHGLAELNLFNAYQHGMYGLAKSQQAAHVWLERAARQGLPRAQYWLGERYLGGIGVDMDREQSLYWLLEAYKQDHRPAGAALRNLGYDPYELVGAASAFDHHFPVGPNDFAPPYSDYYQQTFDVITEMGTTYGQSAGGCRGGQIKDTHTHLHIEHVELNRYFVTRTVTGCEDGRRTYENEYRMIGASLVREDKSGLTHPAYTFLDGGERLVYGRFNEVGRNASRGYEYVTHDYGSSRGHTAYVTDFVPDPIPSSEISRMRSVAMSRRGGDLLGDVLRGVSVGLWNGAVLLEQQERARRQAEADMRMRQQAARAAANTGGDSLEGSSSSGPGGAAGSGGGSSGANAAVGGQGGGLGGAGDGSAGGSGRQVAELGAPGAGQDSRGGGQGGGQNAGSRQDQTPPQPIQQNYYAALVCTVDYRSAGGGSARHGFRFGPVSGTFRDDGASGLADLRARFGQGRRVVESALRETAYDGWTVTGVSCDTEEGTGESYGQSAQILVDAFAQSVFDSNRGFPVTLERMATVTPAELRPDLQKLPKYVRVNRLRVNGEEEWALSRDTLLSAANLLTSTAINRLQDSCDRYGGFGMNNRYDFQGTRFWEAAPGQHGNIYASTEISGWCVVRGHASGYDSLPPCGGASDPMRRPGGDGSRDNCGYFVEPTSPNMTRIDPPDAAEFYRNNPAD